MPKEDRPLLSVIVRRFPQEFERDIDQALRKMQQAAAKQPGFVGLQNSLSYIDDGCELVTVYSFDSSENLQKWKNSPIREGLIGELDKHSHKSVTHAHFDDLDLLLHPKAQLRKIETVVILIFWILILGAALRYLADQAEIFLPAPIVPFWRNALLVSLNVVLISYIFLPWSSMIVTRLKATFTRIRSK